MGPTWTEWIAIWNQCYVILIASDSSSIPVQCFIHLKLSLNLLQNMPNIQFQVRKYNLLKLLTGAIG